jgi:hypothetical protein
MMLLCYGQFDRGSSPTVREGSDWIGAVARPLGRAPIGLDRGSSPSVREGSDGRDKALPNGRATAP